MSDEPKKLGRPFMFTPELISEILLSISEGESERTIFNRPGYPSWRAWSAHKRNHPELIPHYVQAKEEGYKVWEARMLAIAQDTSRDIIYDEIHTKDKNGEVSIKKVAKSDNTAVNRDRLIVDTMKWQMSKIMSKVYGDKVAQEITGADGKDLIPSLVVKIEK